MKRITFHNRAINKKVAMTKYDIAWLIDKVAPLSCATVIYKHLTYKELVEMLYRQLTIKLPTYKGLIDWKNYID